MLVANVAIDEAAKVVCRACDAGLPCLRDSVGAGQSYQFPYESLGVRSRCIGRQQVNMQSLVRTQGRCNDARFVWPTAIPMKLPPSIHSIVRFRKYHIRSFLDQREEHSPTGSQVACRSDGVPRHYLRQAEGECSRCRMRIPARLCRTPPLVRLKACHLLTLGVTHRQLSGGNAIR